MAPSSGDPHHITPAPITPRRESGYEIDLSAMFEWLDFLAPHKPEGIALLLLDADHFAVADRIKLVSMAVRRSKAPLYVNVRHPTFGGTLQLADEALCAGAAGVMAGFAAQLRASLGLKAPVFENLNASPLAAVVPELLNSSHLENAEKEWADRSGALGLSPLFWAAAARKLKTGPAPDPDNSAGPAFDAWFPSWLATITMHG